MRLPSNYRLTLWLVMAVLLIVLLAVPAPEYQSDHEQNDPAETTQQDVLDGIDTRNATPKELQLSIAELGERKLAKRVYLLDPKQRYTGVLAWWHDGEQERLSYIAGSNEVWGRTMVRLWRDLTQQRIYILTLSGDGDLATRMADFPQPYDRLPEGWTLLIRNKD